MILYTERHSYINVLHGQFTPTFSVQQIGELKWLSDSSKWVMSFTGRRPNYYTDLLNERDKRTIIGMLNKLNNIGGSYIPDYESAWKDIIGQRSWIDEALGLETS